MYTGIDQKQQTRLFQIAHDGIKKAAAGLEDMVGQEVRFSAPLLRQVPLFSFRNLLGWPEAEMAAVYLRADGDLAGQFMLITSTEDAQRVVDRLLELPPGTTTSLGRLERSALAEMGNLALAYFLNAAAEGYGMEPRPPPPAVIVDMAGAVLDLLLMGWDGVSDQVMLLQSKFNLEPQFTCLFLPARSVVEGI